MRWILEHLQLVLAVAGAFAYWLSQRKGARDSEDEGAPPATSREISTPHDPEEAERTRRIQDEIRRKIAQRRSGQPIPQPPPLVEERPVAPPVVAPRPAMGQDGGSLREKLARKLAQAREKVEADAAAVRKRQQQYAAEREVLEAERRLDDRRVAEVSAAKTLKQAAVSAAAARSKPHDWLQDMRDPQSLRRAVVLREILGPPVGLR